MAYFIDHKNRVQEYACTPDGIELENGTQVSEEQASAFCFAGDPHDNPRMSIKDGEWYFDDKKVRCDDDN